MPQPRKRSLSPPIILTKYRVKPRTPRRIKTINTACPVEDSARLLSRSTGHLCKGLFSENWGRYLAIETTRKGTWLLVRKWLSAPNHTKINPPFFFSFCSPIRCTGTTAPETALIAFQTTGRKNGVCDFPTDTGVG